MIFFFLIHLNICRNMLILQGVHVPIHAYWWPGNTRSQTLFWRICDGLVQDCSIFSVLATEILQSCTKPSMPCPTRKGYNWFHQFLQIFSKLICTKYWWLSARLHYLQCISNGDIAVLDWAIDMIVLFDTGIYFEQENISRNNTFSLTRSDSHIDGLVQDCSISIANALEILQSCTKPSIRWPNITQDDDQITQTGQYLPH